MKWADMTLADHEAAGVRAYDRDEAAYQRSVDFDYDPGEDDEFLEHVAFESAFDAYLSQRERDEERLVPEEMWVDPRISEQVAA